MSHFGVMGHIRETKKWPKSQITRQKNFWDLGMVPIDRPKNSASYIRLPQKYPISRHQATINKIPPLASSGHNQQNTNMGHFCKIKLKFHFTDFTFCPVEIFP